MARSAVDSTPTALRNTSVEEDTAVAVENGDTGDMVCSRPI